MLTTHHVMGSPVWVDLGTPDLQGAAAFYGGVFGWQFEQRGTEMGGYGVFSKDGKAAGGAMGVPTDQSPPTWSVYFQTPDADATAGTVEEAGGTIEFKPTDVMDLGRTAVFADPSGARFSVWQPGTHTGFDVAGESGGVSWTELYTRDESAAFDFYREVFGWGSSSMPFPDGSGSYRMAYPVGEGPDAMFGGFVPLNSDPVEKGSAPHWLLYFEVDDCDATVATAGDLGATVRMAPTDIEGVGRFAKLGDPNGAGFAVMHGIPST